MSGGQPARAALADRGAGRRAGLAVLVALLALTALGCVLTQIVHGQTERRLLQQRTNEAALVLHQAISTVQAPLLAAAGVADLPDGSDAARALVSDLVGEQRSFAAAELYELEATEPLWSLAGPSQLHAAGADRVREMFVQTVAAPELAVIPLLEGADRRLGYAVRSAGGTRVVYAESALPRRTSGPRAAGPFAELDYALYLGDGSSQQDLLYASVAEVPIRGRTASSTVVFGDERLTLVTTTSVPLGGALSHQLPWFVGVGGLLLSVLGAGATDRVVGGRVRAEQLAADVSGLYEAERTRNVTLQRSLLPRRLHPPPGSTVEVRYWPADTDGQVGGDFYDAFPLGGNRWAITIGDVCGKGVEAASLTSATRHTIRAAAQHVTSLVDVLRWTHEAIVELEADTFCTVCLVVVEPAADGGATIEVALAGHPQPLLRRTDGSVGGIGRHGTVLGLVEPRIHVTRHRIEPGDVLLLYTDGLTDAPDDRALSEADLARLLAAGGAGALGDVAEEIRRAIEHERPSGSGDDAAVLLFRIDGSGPGGRPSDGVERPSTDAIKIGASQADQRT
ncbi:MAG: serine/threonine-protein phosphatase [Acidimicrobiales bacterium]|nr:serine/threonine-protein phosphatase [Acidimicrobiales bacterium]